MPKLTFKSGVCGYKNTNVLFVCNRYSTVVDYAFYSDVFCCNER